MEFLVSISLDLNRVPEGQREALLAAEREAALRLGAEGVIVRMWRVRGEARTVGVWRAESDGDLDAALGRLPLRPWLEVTATALEEHYADPGR
ncbi:muconolactone Delta-isomerase family protein [Phytohabitans sp. ZYX-F-186]|uniref:Muconolactone Delta-isomerase family protein n=1 Tax=Phytohabitans maris TaxID=3071409 RepID=A0ABU0ZW69_9ACTN|nr:muconolactone Delta-isomerase family protein [Phytohabitans sp. ZYX-F-186]MDQ7911280.1 muconolactone Delta-isomerase family protein [Phytohabitans sp. ZYX-F-186]